MKKIIFILSAFLISIASAIDIPKASGKALAVTKGKPCKDGIVFVNGKFIDPPYVVERWGTGIRINGIPVIGQVVEWSEFLKTQAGVKAVKNETPVVVEPEPVEEDEPEEIEEDDDDELNLDDLFDDDPKPKKDAPKKPAPKKKKPRKPRPPKPVTTVTYTLEGDFVPNDASKALVARINKVRTEINTLLAQGGFIFFGDRYSRVSGDERTADAILEKIPEIMKKSDAPETLVSQVRAARLYYLTDQICTELYRNRVDYIRLQQRRDKIKQDRKLKKLMEAK